jgi:single-strand DNA-binding protein
MSTITVFGNLVSDPETKMAAGHKLSRLRLATNERIKDAGGDWKDGDTTYIDVACWRRLAEGAESLKKGERVIVHGKLKGRSFVRKDGTNGYAYEIEAVDVGKSVMAKVKTDVVLPDLENPW